MNLTTSNYNETREKYASLKKHQRDLIKILALIDSPQTRTKIIQVCAKSRIKDKSNQNYTAVELAHELETLKSRWLVKKNLDQKYQINPKAFDFVVRQAVQDSQLKIMRKSVEEALPGINSHTNYNRTAEALYRDICFSIYTDDYLTFLRAKEYVLKNYNVDINILYNIFFVNRFGKENILKLSPEFQLEFYQFNLENMLLRLEDISAPLSNIQKLSAPTDPNITNFINQCTSLNALLKGDWSTVRKTWKGDNTIHAYQHKGWLNFAEGNNHKALEFYGKALKVYRNVEGSKKSFFTGLHGAIYILALLKDDNTKHIPIIKKYFKEVFSFGAGNVFVLLKAIVNALQNNNSYAEELFQQEYIYYNIDGLLYLYTQYWTQIFAPNWEKYAYTLHYKSLKNGHFWIAYNIAALMKVISKDKVDYYSKSAKDLHKKINKAPSLLEIISLREDWEIALNALKSLNGSSHLSKHDNQNRLIWLVNFEEEIIQPKIQKRNKIGKWSKGRSATLTKLAVGDIEEVTLQDKRIANTLSQDFNWNGNGTYGFYDMGKTLKALVGHPLLFLHKSPEVACDFQFGSPELIIKEIETGYEIKPSININQIGYTIFKETPTRYKYIEINSKHLQLHEALGGEKLFIPKKGKELLEKTLTNLSNLIPLQSDLVYHDKKLPKIDADSRIYIHLLPVGDSFHVEFFVKPFKVCPPYFKPGKGSTSVIAVVDSIRSQTQRNLSQELKDTLEIIEKCTILKETSCHDGLWQLEGPISCLELMRDLEPLKSKDCIVVEWPKGEKIKIKQHIDSNNLHLSIKKENNWFGISGKVQVNEKLVLDMRQLLAMLQEQKSEFIELDDGQFLALSSKLRKQLNNIHNLSDDDGRINPLAGFAIDELSENMNNITIDKDWLKHINNLKTIQNKNYKVPHNLKAKLRDYQKEGFQWLSKLAEWGVGACLADDMGLGKTVQTLAIILKRSTNGPSLVVAPASVCRNWLKEIKKFSPSLDPIIFGEQNRKETILNSKANQVLITTYGLLQSESELFCDKEFTTIVLDEAQAIKNNTAKRSKAAMKLKGSFKIITTGTPIENHLGELWNLFRFINPGLLGSSKNFRARFAIPIEREKNKETLSHLQLLIRPFILRRHKKDVLKELPAKTEVILNVQLSEKENAFYEALRQEAIESLENNKDDRAGTKHLKVLAQLMRLRRACCNPQLVNPATTLKSAKLELFGKIIEEIIENGHKALVFSQFVGHLQLIENYVQKKGIAYQYLDGQTPLKKRHQHIDAFQNGQGSLFLISLKAGGTGLNLTAADYVIHMDPWWNPAVEDQASDRAHRIGQKRPVTVYRLITENTIEEKIIKLHDNKRELADSLLKGTDASSKLSAKDLLDLIKYH
ncbi:MAG: DEAD/DEAH box helicase [Saprospiraceae bacterium]|nr:DEAD/DEAH box helicase [Saprospiraceae bacterium]